MTDILQGRDLTEKAILSINFDVALLDVQQQQFTHVLC